MFINRLAKTGMHETLIRMLRTTVLEPVCERPQAFRQSHAFEFATAQTDGLAEIEIVMRERNEERMRDSA